MSKEKFKRAIRRVTAAAAALALAVSFTFPEGTEIMGVSFGNAIVASAATVASGDFGEGLHWELDDAGKLTISYTGSGSGAMDNWGGVYKAPWFNSYRGNIKTVVIGQGVTSIGNWAFYECSNIERISIGDSVTSIGNNAFAGCSSLTSITIPSSVTYIEELAFPGCSSFTSINVNENNQNYCSVDGVLFNKSQTTLVACPNGKEDYYVIPDGVTSIGNYAFEHCSSLTRITIPNSVTSIGNNAFAGCSSLTSITIPNSVNFIGNYAFERCSSLTSIFLPQRLNVENASIPGSAKQIKYTVHGNKVTITEIIPGTGQTSADIPEKIGGYPVISVATAYQNYVGNHTHYFSNNICGLCSGAEYVTGITVSPDTLSVTVGDPASQLTATVVPANALDTSVEWTSSDTSVATVDDSGNVTAVGKGTATIKATAKDGSGIYGECAVTVNARSYNISISAEIRNGRIMADSTAKADDTVTITVTPDQHYKLKNLTVNDSTNNQIVCMKTDANKYKFKMPKSNVAIFAEFDPAHTLSKVERVEPTCTADGNKEYWSCDGCSLLFSDKNGINETTLVDVTLSALGHDLSKVERVEPTCTTEGNTEYYRCSRSRCGELFTDENGTNSTTLDNVTLSALGHDLSKVEAVEPTCTTEGNTEYYRCSTCVKLFSDENGINETTLDIVTLPVDNTAHRWSATWEKDTTHHWHKCLNTGCNDIKDKAEHSSNAAATEVSPEVCKDCEYVMAPALGHIHANHLTFAAEVPETCTTDGVKAHYECDCGKLFADDQAAAEVTPQSLKIAAHHSYGTEWVSDNDDDHYHVCSVCGDKTDITVHSYDNGVITTEPTEQATGIKTYTCSVCNHQKTEVVPKLAHTHIPSDEYSKDETGHWHTCRGCAEKLDFAAHTYGKWKITVPATADANGKKERVCTVCGYVQEGTVIYGGDDSTGDFDNATDPENNALHADLELTDEEIINKIPLTDEELEEIENGADLTVYMVVIDYSANVSAEEKAAAETVLNDGMKIGMYIDVSLFKKVGDNEPKPVTQTNGDLKITFEMPVKLLNTDKDVTREYSIIRVHSGNADILDCAYDSATGKGSFNTYQFSTYAIAYRDTTVEEPAPVVVKYPIIVSGNVYADKTCAAAGETVNVRSDFGYDIIVTAENGQRIAKITEKGSFTMPASKVYVTAVQNETFALMATAWRQSYVYSYDSDMNKINVNSTKKRGIITVNLGKEYAGKSFTIYSGRKSTKVKVTEGEFDENGKFVFEVPDGKNYTLVVEE